MADSQNLAKNLEKVFGYKKIAHSEAHHIIPKAEAEAAPLRDLLKLYGIHPDDASNGTFMVSTRMRNQFGANSDWLNGLGPNHQNHRVPSDYIEQLELDLAQFKDLDPTPENVNALKNKLQLIASKLVNNQYPWP